MTKASFVSAETLASEMGITFRDFSYHGKEDPTRLAVRAPGCSDEDKTMLMNFMKRTGLKTIPCGKDRKRYFQGMRHCIAFIKRADLKKAKAKVEAPKPEPKTSVFTVQWDTQQLPGFNKGIEAVAAYFEQRGNKGLAAEARGLLRVEE